MVPAVTKPMVETPNVPIEKFRSRNRRRGTSGSVRTRDCHQTNVASPAVPAMMSARVVPPQPWDSPCWMPYTRRNMPTADRTMPGTS